MEVKGLRVVLLGAFGVILVAGVVRSMWVLAAVGVVGILGQVMAIAGEKRGR